MLLRSGNSPALTEHQERVHTWINFLVLWMDFQYFFMKFMLCCDDYYYDVQHFFHCSRALTEYILSSRKNMKINIMGTFSTVVGVNSGIKLSFAESEKNLLNIFFLLFGSNADRTDNISRRALFYVFSEWSRKKERSVWCDVVDDVSAREEKCGENRKKNWWIINFNKLRFGLLCSSHSLFSFQKIMILKVLQLPWRQMREISTTSSLLRVFQPQHKQRWLNVCR